MLPHNARRTIMDPTTTFCPNRHCPARGQTGKGNIGIHSQKEQRFICHACHKTFSARKGTVFYRLRTSAETVAIVVTLLAHGCPLQAIVAAFGFDERTVAAWQAKTGGECQQGHAHLGQEGGAERGGRLAVRGARRAGALVAGRRRQRAARRGTHRRSGPVGEGRGGRPWWGGHRLGGLRRWGWGG